MSPGPGPAVPQPPWRDDGVTIRTCPACGQPFAPSGRRRWCSDTCKQAAWRRRATAAVPEPPAPPKGRRREITVYECSQCGHRELGTQRCDGCGTFMHALGIGGLCPCCDEPVAIQELLTAEQR